MFFNMNLIFMKIDDSLLAHFTQLSGQSTAVGAQINGHVVAVKG